ncbi:MAG TPA: hypothetical protein PLO16_12690 [Acidocella sp.]|nr:hypothetical protein [Acidocella sp.]
MGALTEREIFDCLVTNFRLAAEHCEDLAKLPARGPTYNALRHELLLIEGACRQASVWREDTRWLSIGLMMHEAHERAGHWLRRHYPRPLFLKLADNLRAALKLAEQYQHTATHRLGMILPETPKAIRTEGRAVQVSLPHGMRQTASGLIIPDSAAA